MRSRTVRANKSAALGLAAALTAAGLAACQGCHGTTAGSAATGGAVPGAPTVRLYLVSDLAGALEPCGCTKDQLGGVDHAGAWIQSERAKAPSSALFAAGPLFFLDADLKDARKDQETAKAETLASSLKALGLAGFAGGANDWADGKEELSKLSSASGAPMLAANLGAPWEGARIREINGVKVGLVGVSALPVNADMRALPPEETVKARVVELQKQGANVIIVLASVGRGEAKRIADTSPDVTAIVVGSESSAGEGNTTAPPAERVGEVLIAETANHLQSIAVLDLFVRGGSYKFADGTGLEQAAKREALTRRIDELRVKIAAWEKDGKIAKSDLDARRADLAKVEAEQRALDERPPPAEGSFFRYSVKEIRESLGQDPAIRAELAAYYKKVNDHNKVAFADRLPRPHAPEEPVFVGIDVCTTCHKPEREFWDGTTHAKAYATLSSQSKEFNLDCVSCHVTGYDMPGGSTVTHVQRLENVQCEVCHGPGSKHSANPKKVSPVSAHPKEDACLSCHHPPHVEAFDAKAKMADILGPGHGF